MRKKFACILPGLLGMLLVWAGASVWAKYKAPAWTLGAREQYPAFLTSEAVTIAVDPLYTDALAARVFDKPDMITRGIMPLAVIIFNDNDFAVQVEGMSMELIRGEQRLRTMPPNEVVYRLFRKDKAWTSQPLPRISRSDLNTDALEDFDAKFFMDKTVAPHSQGGGFLYVHIPETADQIAYLAESRLYIPKIYRLDDGSRMIFFEIDLAPAMRAPAMRGSGTPVAR